MAGNDQARSALRLVGPASIDRYIEEAVELPGGGALNMAYHWRSAGHPVTLLSRVARDHAMAFDRFVTQHGITVTDGWYALGDPCSIDIRITDDRQPAMDGFVEGVLGEFALGDPCSIDIRITDDRQPAMDGFVEGVLGEFRPDPTEVDAIVDGTPTHFVLVDVVDAALHAIAADRPADATRARWTGDFLGFRHMTGERFSATMAHLELGIVGWPGDPDDVKVTELAARAADLGRTLVVTFGSQGILAVDARGSDRVDRWFDVDARQVTGSTIGCGDAFAAAALSTWFETSDLAAAVDAGRRLGANATEWVRPLPDSAYATSRS
ncbi:MAG: carbohydrate kinase family protein [Acidimicrobiia bacterium]|nr:carbohydrate kinase family protein [Acidimicrobiia bacterium]